MDQEKKKALERKFDRELTDGEAAEIEHTQVLHKDDEDFYENNDSDDDANSGAGVNGIISFGVWGTRNPT